MPPRNGKLFELSASVPDGPPLSLVSTMRVSSHMPFALRAAVALRTTSSAMAVMAWYVDRTPHVFGSSQG